MTAEEQHNFKAQKKIELDRSNLGPAGRKLFEVEADGNCLFRCVADSLVFGSADRDHMMRRNQVVDQLDEDISNDFNLYVSVLQES